MKYISFNLIVILIISLGPTGLLAQENMNSTGGNAKGEGGSVSYSVGQVTYTTKTGTTNSVAEGVQQPYEISVITGIEHASGMILSVRTFPNPTDDFFILSVEDINLSGLSYKLFDLNGKLLQYKNLTSNQTRINLIGLNSATYFLKVFQENKEITAFKIIKR